MMVCTPVDLLAATRDVKLRIQRRVIERAQLDAAANLDLARGDVVRGADVDIVARAGAQRLHHQTRAILSPIEKEARLSQARVEVGILRRDPLVEWNDIAKHSTWFE